MPEKNFRTAGIPPIKLVLVHGGPGAAGTMYQLALKLILVASAPLEDRYVPGIMETRINPW